MQISQIQVANDTIQDRLTLRVATQSNEEFRVFFTRRFLRELWPHLIAMQQGHLAAPAALPTKPQPEGEPASFDKPFRDDNPTYPLGVSPLLASEASLAANGPGLAQLTFREGRERSFNLNLTGELLQALCAMLRASAEQAQWDLRLDYTPTANQLDAPGNAAQKPSLLH